MPILTVIATAKEVFGVGAELWRYVSKLREAARQSAEWTAEQDAEFDRALTEAGIQAHWQTR